jgi:predicted nucleic acid-binding protein
LIVLDSSGLFAALVDTEVHHERARSALEQGSPPFVLSPFVLCELDYLLTSSVGVDPELALLEDVAAGAYELASFDGGDVAAAHELIERYRDLGVGLADASIVVLAGRYGTDRVLTLDERHFRAVRAPKGRPFTLLPADA